jgi:hypothetical protein
MFTNEDTALSVNNHMKNIVWLISATTLTSPVTDSSPEEQQAYNEIVSKICAEIIENILDPIFAKYPNLPDHTAFHYQRHLNRRKPESELDSDTMVAERDSGNSITFEDRHLAMQIRDLIHDIGRLAHRARFIANDGNWTEKERVKFKNRLCLGIDDSISEIGADIYRDHHDLVPEEQRIFFSEWFGQPESE